MAKDPYKYFRVEARELLEGLGRGALELERNAGGAELVVGMLRLAHTLKGAARVVGQAAIADLAHGVEDLLEPRRTSSGTPIAPGELSLLLQRLDQMSVHVAALGAEATEGSPVAAAVPSPEPLENVRVAIGEMDDLLEGVFETDVRLTAIRRDCQDLARAGSLAASLVRMLPAASGARVAAEELLGVLTRADRNLAAGLDHADHEIAQVREKAHELRLVPASAVFAELERAARDAGQLLGKQVRLECSGGDHRLEANVLFAVRDALLHVVRNAVAHGIEAPADRRRLGKPPEGLVRLEVQRRGHRIAFVCRDDGRGIDVDAVRHAAAARGLATVADADLGAAQILRLVLESGLTTSESVTQVSGRGIGLDVLRATAEKLKGDIRLATEPGRGTTVDVCVPVSLSSVSALVVDAGGLTCSLPLDSVKQTLRVTSGDIARSVERDSIVVDGTALPFMPLASVLGRAPSSALARAWSAVVVEAGTQRAAVGVDRLVGTTSVVLRPLPRLAGPVPVAAGASLDGDGNPRLVLDPRGLVDAVHASRGAPVEAADGKTREPVLVIDDSLTTRMLEQSILESAGYDVDTAVSAEEGLVRARQAPHSLFLVDVEMPGMDGFEFVAHTRADPALRGTPAILVTSRHSADDRRRGAEVGAHAYIVKGEFDQGLLLRTIRLLIG